MPSDSMAVVSRRIHGWPAAPQASAPPSAVATELAIVIAIEIAAARNRRAEVTSRRTVPEC